MAGRSSDKTHLLVLGGGPAGYAGAFRAADLGLRVTLVDREPNPGGVCLFRGCIPSKALLHVAKVMTEAREAETFGLDFGKPKLDLGKMRAWKDGVVRNLTKGLGQLSKARKIEYVHGQGRFLDSHTVEVDLVEGGTKRIGCDVCMLATGSYPFVPKDFDIGSDRVMDSDGALALESVPKTMLQIGGGYIGLEMAIVYAALGTEVTVVEMTNGLLPGADRDLVEVMRKELERRVKGVHLNTMVVGMKEVGGGVEVELSGLKVEEPRQVFEKVLVSIGRRPVTEGFGLEKTGVRVNARGFVETDGQRRTNDAAIFAVGDVAGEPMLAHKASYEARMAAEVIAGNPAAFDAQAIPAVMFTDPEVAWAGLTETAAKERNIPVKIGRFPWGASGRALTLNRRDGLTKVLADPATGQILGVGVVGPGAGELLAEGAFAVEIGARLEDLGLTVHAHPTLSETLMEAAETVFGTSTHYYTKM